MKAMQKGFSSIVIICLIVIVLLVGGLLYTIKSSTPQSQNPKVTTQTSSSPNQTIQTSISTSPLPTKLDSSPRVYTSQAGKYSFNDPNNVKIYINEKYSVDGVKIPLKDTVVLISDLLPELKTNYQMSINHQTIDADTTLKQFVDKNSSCQDIVSSKGKFYILGGKNALIFEDTPCGPSRVTAIYVLNNELGYIIEIETAGNYNEIRNYTDQVLSTLKFIQ